MSETYIVEENVPKITQPKEGLRGFLDQEQVDYLKELIEKKEEPKIDERI